MRINLLRKEKSMAAIPFANLLYIHSSRVKALPHIALNVAYLAQQKIGSPMTISRSSQPLACLASSRPSLP